MINIINNILVSCGYQQTNIEYSLDNYAVFLFIPAGESDREEYFVTLQAHIQSDLSARAILEEEAQELFELIRNSGKVEQPFEKNCTMVICCEHNKINRMNILALEEDQYNFKKNVVSYTAQELHSLKTYMADKKIECLTNSVINNILNSEGGKSFLDFKENNQSSKGYYSLILKSALKLPFITYSPQEQQLIDLNREIEQSFTQRQSYIYTQLMKSEVVWTDENIHQQIEQIWGDVE